MSKKVLFIQRHKSGRLAREALDAALVTAVFDQSVAMLFREDGIWQLIESDDQPDVAEAIRSLPDYGIEQIYACPASLEAAGIAADELLLPVVLLDAAGQTDLIGRQELVLGD